MRRIGLLLVSALMVTVATACQSPVVMWGACTPAANGDATGTDGAYVLACVDGTWRPLMTVKEFTDSASGKRVTFGPLPTEPTTSTTSTTSTTVPAATVDVEILPDADQMGITMLQCPPGLLRVQTFTAGRTGVLEAISLNFVGAGGVEVSVRTTEDGVPTETEIGYGITSEAPTDLADVDIEMTDPANLTSGVRYAVVLTTQTACDDPPAISFVPLNVYEGGQFLTTSSTSAGFVPAGGDIVMTTWMR